VPSEAELRALLRGDIPTASDRIDVDAVLRRSRARRRPRVALVSALGAAAVLAIVVPVAGVAISAFRPAGMTASDTAAEAPQAPEDDHEAAGQQPGGSGGTAPAIACGSPVAESPRAANGLVAEVAPVEAAAAADRVDVVVTLRNTGDERLVGWTQSAPALTFSSGEGTVLWYSTGPMTMMAVEVDLEPGEAMELPASFEPAVCGADDDPAALPEGLPRAGAGDYAVSASVLFTPEEGDDGPVLVTGPAAPVVLR